MERIDWWMKVLVGAGVGVWLYAIYKGCDLAGWV